MKTRSKGGFTLIEIMMVVAIIGLTLTMMLPSFVHAIKKEGMRKALEDVTEACKAARGEAIMKAQEVDLVFHPLDKTFEVPGAFESATLPRDVTIDIMGVNFIELEQADVAKVRFFPNGTSDEFTMVLHGDDGSMRKISLDTVTALTEVENIR